MKYPKVNGFVGFRGDNVPLEPYPDDHPVVAAFPDLFTDTPPPGVEAPRPKRRALKKAAATPTEKPVERPTARSNARDDG
jgi:hypothetical protein